MDYFGKEKVKIERIRNITEEQAHEEGFYRGWSATENSTPAETAK